jgi:hypothetical protein
VYRVITELLLLLSLIPCGRTDATKLIVAFHNFVMTAASDFAGSKAVISLITHKLAARLIGIERSFELERLEIIWLFPILVIQCLQVFDLCYGGLIMNCELLR